MAGNSFLRFALVFLLLLRRGEPLARGAVTFFSGKKESNQRKLPRERGVAGRYNGPSIHFASLVPLSASPRRSGRICSLRMLEVWDARSPKASRSAIGHAGSDAAVRLGRKHGLVRDRAHRRSTGAGGWWGIGQRGSGVGIDPGTCSGAKLYFQTNRTAVFDQTRPMAEREAFGERASRSSSFRFPGAVINDTMRTRGERSGAKSRPSLMRFPAPGATFFGDFLFCQKRKLLASTRLVDSTDGVAEEKKERSGGQSQ